MRACAFWMVLCLVASGGCVGHSPSDPSQAETVRARSGPVERVVYLQVEAQSTTGQGADLIEGHASFFAGAHLPEAWRPPEGTCAHVPEPMDPWSVRGGLGVLFDFGEPLELTWDSGRRVFAGEQAGEGRDLAWQPVSAASSGSGLWAFESRRAVQFGETPMAWIAERRSTGDVVVRWHGSYRRDDLLVRVVGDDFQITCTPGADQVVVPWWAMTLVGARLELAATRHQHVLTETGTLLVGDATIVVPVRANASDVLETLSSEQAEPFEEAPSRSFGPNRIRRGTRPGLVRSSPS